MSRDSQEMARNIQESPLFKSRNIRKNTPDFDDLTRKPRNIPIVANKGMPYFNNNQNMKLSSTNNPNSSLNKQEKDSMQIQANNMALDLQNVGRMGGRQIPECAQTTDRDRRKPMRFQLHNATTNKKNMAAPDKSIFKEPEQIFHERPSHNSINYQEKPIRLSRPSSKTNKRSQEFTSTEHIRQNSREIPNININPN